MRIAFVRPDHLGDVLLTLPAATALRRALPNARITFLVAPGVTTIPRHCPAVDETIGVSFPTLTATTPPPAWVEARADELAALRGRFDLALLPRPDDPWSGPLVAALAVPVRLGYDVPRTRPFLTVALPIVERRHVAALALDLTLVAASHCGVTVPASRVTAREPPRFVPTADEEEEARAMLAELVVESGPAPLVLHPGSGWPLKNWSPRAWGALANALQRRYGVTPLVTGSAAERSLVDAVVLASAGRARGLAGRFSLGGLAALYRRARLVIATDSGPLHLATAMGTLVVGLYGPADPQLFGPWCPPDRYRAVRIGLPCSPCGTLLDPPCGARTMPACVRGISVGAVLAAASALLGA